MDWSLAARLRTAATGGQTTHLSVYTELAKLRSHEALLMGDVNTHAINSTFVLTRVKKVSWVDFTGTGTYQSKSLLNRNYFLND